jgi:hypothetical protein
VEEMQDTGGAASRKEHGCDDERRRVCACTRQLSCHSPLTTHHELRPIQYSCSPSCPQPTTLISWFSLGAAMTSE